MFSGIWFKCGEYEIPPESIVRGTYKTKPSQVQDLNSFTNGNGVTIRNALEHTKSQVNFTLKRMREAKMAPIIDGIRSNFLNQLERDAYCTYYDAWEHDYKTVHMYIDPSVEFDLIEEIKGKLEYGETQMLFIEY